MDYIFLYCIVDHLPFLGQVVVDIADEIVFIESPEKNGGNVHFVIQCIIIELN